MTMKQLTKVEDLIEGDEMMVDDDTTKTVHHVGMAGGGEMMICFDDGSRTYLLPTDLVFVENR